MLDSFLTFINQQKLDLSGRRTLLTVSGGVDSIVMLNLFHRAGLTIGIAHCNFGLRGEESVQDEMFVRSLADFYGCSVFVKHFDVKRYAKQESVSTQMAARTLRYEWFEEIREQNSFDWIATAHHANDSLETSLLNLVRGTGIAGLYGISSRNRYLIRPMLFATKQEILSYAQENQLVWREDRSNASLDYKRNVIRHKVVPVLKEMNPSLESTFLATSEKIKASDTLLSEFLTEWRKKVMSKAGDELRISIETLLSASEPVYRLWVLLNEYGFSYAQISPVIRSLNNISGKVFYSDTHVLLKDRKLLILKKLNEEKQDESLTIAQLIGEFDIGKGHLIFEKEVRSLSFNLEKKNSVVYFDENKLMLPLSLRNWLPGDEFCPFGMNGRHKKISDLLIDLKLSVYQKRKVKVLVNGNGDIIWVLGIRSDERYRISEETDNIIKVEWKEE